MTPARQTRYSPPVQSGLRPPLGRKWWRARRAGRLRTPARGRSMTPRRDRGPEPRRPIRAPLPCLAASSAVAPSGTPCSRRCPRSPAADRAARQRRPFARRAGARGRGATRRPDSPARAPRPFPRSRWRSAACDGGIGRARADTRTWRCPVVGHAAVATGPRSSSRPAGSAPTRRPIWKVGFRTLATKWGAAWALSLLDDWSCEGLLQQLHDLQPDVATYTCLLALAQTHRDKLHSAIGNAERGVALEPANRAAAFLLANLLLMVGRTAAAAERLDLLQDYVRTEVRTAFSMVRLRLMQRDTAGALEWAGVVRGLDSEGASLIGLGQAFGAARLAEPAATFFQAAAEAHFAPEANIGFAVLASLRGDRAGARRYLLAALKFEDARFTSGQTAGNLFHEILGRLNGLAEQRLDCTAWIATVPDGSRSEEHTSELQSLAYLVCRLL